MPEKLSLEQWPAKLAEAIKASRPAVLAAAYTIAAEAAGIARASIGTYQGPKPPFGAWAPLAESTIEDKTRRGYAPPDNPLLRSGELRESIRSAAVSVGNTASAVAVIGSDDQRMTFFEFGTSRMPPRPVIGPAMIEVEPFAKRELGKTLALMVE